jgi:cobalamin synthase
MSDGDEYDLGDALLALGEFIEEWGILNDRNIGANGSFALARAIHEELRRFPRLAELLGRE